VDGCFFNKSSPGPTGKSDLEKALGAVSGGNKNQRRPPGFQLYISKILKWSVSF
jgi:hypothetical protein